jgi:opacity protein-like surface antigen
MKKVVVGFVSAAALATVGMAAASNSMAASTQSSNSNAAGVFVSGNLGYGKVDYRNTGLAAKYLRGFTWNANLGYQFNQYLAIEGGYTQFNSIKVTAGALQSTQTIHGISLLAKAIYPINDQFNVFAKAGAMDLIFKNSSNVVGATNARRERIVPEFGVGTSYNVSSNVALTLQGITTLAAKHNVPATYAAYAGVSYKFNV